MCWREFVSIFFYSFLWSHLLTLHMYDRTYWCPCERMITPRVDTAQWLWGCRANFGTTPTNRPAALSQHELTSSLLCFWVYMWVCFLFVAIGSFELWQLIPQQAVPYLTAQFCRKRFASAATKAKALTHFLIRGSERAMDRQQTGASLQYNSKINKHKKTSQAFMRKKKHQRSLVRQSQPGMNSGR